MREYCKPALKDNCKQPCYEKLINKRYKAKTSSSHLLLLHGSSERNDTTPDITHQGTLEKLIKFERKN